MTDNDTHNSPPTFEESVSPLYSSNDGRVKVDREHGTKNRYVLSADSVPVWSTRNRVLADAFIAGWDARADADDVRDHVEGRLVLSDRKTILLGTMIGSADLAGIGRLEIIGTGDTLEFSVRMDDGSNADYRMSLQPFAMRAIELAREETHDNETER